MPKVIVQPNLAGEIGIDAEMEIAISEETIRLREFLDRLFGNNRVFRYSITDETNAIRRHINVLVNDRATKDLETPIAKESEIYIFRALSGG